MVTYLSYLIEIELDQSRSSLDLEWKTFRSYLYLIEIFVLIFLTPSRLCFSIPRKLHLSEIAVW